MGSQIESLRKEQSHNSLFLVMMMVNSHHFPVASDSLSVQSPAEVPIWEASARGREEKPAERPGHDNTPTIRLFNI